MDFYIAPLEAITGYVFRNAHHRHFPGIDKYFIPFIEPKPNARKTWTGRVWNDIQPDHNKGIEVVPQILTNKWEDFLWTADHLKELGYTEVNLNLGCPSRTVVSKNRGSGFLYCLDELDAFLYYIFEQCSLSISIKTRIGRDTPDEFEEIMKIYEKYPISELIIHPRTQKDFYNGPLTMESFGAAYTNSKHVLGYNGEIVTVPDYKRLADTYPDINSCMLGRGILRNPQLVENIKEGTIPDRKRIKVFHDELYQDYNEALSGDVQVLFRMKELWCYMRQLFDDPKGYTRKMLKCKKIEDFLILKETVFNECDITTKESDYSTGLWIL